MESLMFVHVSSDSASFCSAKDGGRFQRDGPLRFSKRSQKQGQCLLIWKTILFKWRCKNKVNSVMGVHKTTYLIQNQPNCFASMNTLISADVFRSLVTHETLFAFDLNKWYLDS